MKTAAKSKTKSTPAASRYALDAHHRVFVGCCLAALALLISHGHVTLPTQLVLGWNTFALTSVTLAWTVICTKDPYEVRRNARLQDASATFLFVLVVSAATASLVAVGLLLGTAKGLPPAGLAAYIALAVASVFISWTLVHTIFTLRYAHLYFRDAREVERHAVSGGLIFPGECQPDYLDFAYFSFVVGMTCQVSDVQIAAPSLRRLALVHGLISFAFNTAILAMFVNIVAGLV
jgi:uncharacterized membrane protein